VRGRRVELFAEQSDWGLAAVATVATLFGGAAAWVVTQWRAWRVDRRKEALEDESRELTRQEALIKRLDNERVELREQIRKVEHGMDELEGRVRFELIRAERMSAYMTYYEALLTDAKIPFQRYPREVAPDGSQPHPALPSGDVTK
jgi:hypothetical protein